MTLMFMSFTGSSYIMDQNEFYAFMQNFKELQYVVAGTLALNLLFSLFAIVLTCKKTLRYRLEF